MYFYLANTGFESTPTSTAAPSNRETTVIPIGHHAPYKRSYHGQGLCSISLHYPSDRVTIIAWKALGRDCTNNKGLILQIGVL